MKGLIPGNILYFLGNQVKSIEIVNRVRGRFISLSTCLRMYRKVSIEHSILLVMGALVGVAQVTISQGKKIYTNSAVLNALNQKLGRQQQGSL